MAFGWLSERSGEKTSCPKNFLEINRYFALTSKGGAVVRALASHQCGPGSNPGVDAICGLSLLLVLSFAPRGFSPGTPVFPSPQKPTLPNSNSIWNARRSLNEFIWVKKQFTIIFTSYCNTIFQSSNVFSILGGFFGGKTKSPCFDLFIHWLIKQIANTYQNHFSRSYENRSKLLEQVHVTCAKGGKVVKFLLMLIMIGRLSVGRPRNLLVRGMRCF